MRISGLYNKGDEERPQKISSFWMSKSKSPKNDLLQHTNIVEIGGGVYSLRSSFDLEYWWDWTLGPTGFWTSESRSSKKCCAITDENRLNGGYTLFMARFTLKMGQTSCQGQPEAQPKFLRTFTKILGIFNVGILITKEMLCYIIR